MKIEDLGLDKVRENKLRRFMETDPDHKLARWFRKVLASGEAYPKTFVGLIDDHLKEW